MTAQPTLKDLENFIVSTQGHMEVLFIGPGDLLDMMLSDRPPSIETLRFGGAIAQWLAEMHRRKKRDRLLCIGCETSFSQKSPPAGFAITVPFANRDAACVSGICGMCASEGHVEAALRGMRRLMPDCRVEEPTRV